jgi:hypothetical protein
VTSQHNIATHSPEARTASPRELKADHDRHSGQTTAVGNDSDAVEGDLISPALVAARDWFRVVPPYGGSRCKPGMGEPVRELRVCVLGHYLW